MKIIRAYKTELDPTCKQIGKLLQHAGTSRWAYNWGLRKKIEAHKEGVKNPSAIDLHKELIILKKTPIEKGGIPWLSEVSKWAPQEALRNLDKAYLNAFRRCKTGAKKRGFPKFKSKKESIGSFRLGSPIRLTTTRIQLPIIGRVKLKEQGYLPIGGVRILSATISEVSGRWYVSIQVEQEISPNFSSVKVVGVDVGVEHLAVTSDGKIFDNPRALINLQETLRIRHKAVSRKNKGSHNRRKAVHRLAVLHARVANIRKDAIHKMTSTIVKSASVVVIESLNVAGMLKNHHLARSLSDASLGEIHRQLRYKMKWSGGCTLEADRFFPSSKRCSRCGNVRSELSLGERIYTCNKCGYIEDRDFNAALNLKSLAPSSGVTACCPESSGLREQTKLLVGQEPSRKDQAYV